MHMIIYRILERITMLDPASYVWRFFMSFVIYGIVWQPYLLKKIPILKHIVP